MKKTIKTSLSLLLALCMLVSICAVPAMADNVPEVTGDNGLYVYVGDSMTYDFVGSHNGYLPSVNIYAWQAARAMGYTTDDFGKFPGGRATDVYAALSDYPGDAYSFSELKGYVTGTRAENFKAAVTDAKAVSLQVGYSELTTFLLANLGGLLSDGEPSFNCDLSQIFSQEELAKIMPFVSKSLKLIDSIVPEGTQLALSQFFAQLSDAEKEAVISVIGQDAFDTLSGVTTTAGALRDIFVYTMASAIVHFDALVAEILKVNPDVDLYVMGLVNPMTQLSVGFNLNGTDFSLNLGELLGGFYTIMNSYYRVFSPYSDQYYFVENLHHVETFSEVMVNDEDITAAILYALYNTNPTPVNGARNPRNGYSEDEAYARNESAYAKAKAQAPGVMQMLKNTSMIDLSKVIADLVSGNGSLDTSEKSFEKLASYDENGNITASYVEQLGAHVALFGILKGIYVHPTQAGHDAEAPLLIAAMQNKQVDPLAIAYHKLMAPMEMTIEALDNSTTIDEFISWVENVKEIWKDTPAVDEGDEGDDDADVDDGDQGETPPAPQPTVLEKVGTVVKNIVKTVTVTVSAVLAKVGSFFRR